MAEERIGIGHPGWEMPEHPDAVVALMRENAEWMEALANRERADAYEDAIRNWKQKNKGKSPVTREPIPDPLPTLSIEIGKFPERGWPKWVDLEEPIVPKYVHNEGPWAPPPPSGQVRMGKHIWKNRARENCRSALRGDTVPGGQLVVAADNGITYLRKVVSFLGGGGFGGWYVED